MVVLHVKTWNYDLRVDKMIEKLLQSSYYVDCYSGEIENIRSQIDELISTQKEIVEKVNEIIDYLDEMI